MSGAERWRLTEDEWLDRPYYNLAVEEAIPRAVGQGDVPPTLRFWRNDNTIVIGRFQCPALEIRFDACQRSGTTVVRRFTGGGAVYHDAANLNYALSLPVAPSDDPPDIFAAFARVGAAVRRGLALLGVDAEFRPINDLQVGAQKISGMAGSLLPGVSFVHGCLLVGSDLVRLGEVLNVPQAKLEGKGVRSVVKRVTTLQEVLGRPVEMAEVKEVLRRGFEAEYQVTLERGGLSAGERALAERLQRDLYLAPDWTLGPCRRCASRAENDALLREVAARR